MYNMIKIMNYNSNRKLIEKKQLLDIKHFNANEETLVSKKLRKEFSLYGMKFKDTNNYNLNHNNDIMKFFYDGDLDNQSDEANAFWASNIGHRSTPLICNNGSMRIATKVIDTRVVVENKPTFREFYSGCKCEGIAAMECNCEDYYEEKYNELYGEKGGFHREVNIAADIGNNTRVIIQFKNKLYSYSGLKDSNCGALMWNMGHFPLPDNWHEDGKYTNFYTHGDDSHMCINFNRDSWVVKLDALIDDFIITKIKKY